MISLRPQVQLQRPVVRFRDRSTKEILGSKRSDVPDLIITTSSLSKSNIAQEGATVLTRSRRGQPFHGEPALVWTINGEKGEIRVTSPSAATLGAFAAEVIVEVHDFETDQVQRIDWSWLDWQEELPVMSRNIGTLYDNFAVGKGDTDASFKDALVRHEQLESILAGWDATQ